MAAKSGFFWLIIAAKVRWDFKDLESASSFGTKLGTICQDRP